MIVLDTDILTLIQRKSGDEYHRLTARLDGSAPQAVCVTIVSFEEQLRGWLAWIAQSRKVEQLVVAYGRLLALLKDFQSRPV